MNKFWIATLGASALAFALKYFGHSIPAKYLTSERLKRINGFIPVALLSALVSVQAFTNKHDLQLDHRAIGVFVAGVALKIKMPFPVVIVSAAIASAVFYRLNN